MKNGITGFIATINSLTFPDFYMLENDIIFPDQMDLSNARLKRVHRCGWFFKYSRDKHHTGTHIFYKNQIDEIFESS